MIPEEYTRITEKSEMTLEDHNLILDMLGRSNPKKILEIGVCAGGTTSLLLSVLPRDAALYSVDTATHYLRDPAKETGYVARQRYDPATQARWITHFGVDVSCCLDQIGPGIDFAILDTTHVLPGEILSFLAILPFMAEDSTLVLHDVSNHLLHKIGDEQVDEYCKNEHCTTLLFNAIAGDEKILSDAIIPNCGAIRLNRDRAMRNIFMVLNILFLDWFSVPAPRIMAKTMRIVREYYSEKNARLFELAYQYNLGQKALKKRNGSR